MTHLSNNPPKTPLRGFWADTLINVPRQLTQRMQDVLEMRRSRMSFRAIGNQLNVDESSVRESFNRALKYLAAESITDDALVRIEEVEFADARIRDYLDMYDKYKDDEPHTALTALGGAHRYFETLVKIRGMEPARKVSLTGPDGGPVQVLETTQEDLELQELLREAKAAVAKEAKINAAKKVKS
jgi:DNA-binding CsgD family transcriptional regulator